MTRAPHPLDRTGSEHLGPMDVRSIEADDIAAARARAVALVREIRAAEGHRAAVTAALAAVMAATDALVELGAGGAALNTLRMVAAGLEERKVGPVADARGRLH